MGSSRQIAKPSGTAAPTMSEAVAVGPSFSPRAAASAIRCLIASGLQQTREMAAASPLPELPVTSGVATLYEAAANILDVSFAKRLSRPWNLTAELGKDKAGA